MSKGEAYRSAHRMLHRLWTKAVGTSDYDKDEWMQLEAAIGDIARSEGGPLKPPFIDEQRNP